MFDDEIAATQCLAVATRFGPISAPLQRDVPLVSAATTATANACVVSIVPSSIGLDDVAVGSGANDETDEGLPHANADEAASVPTRRGFLIRAPTTAPDTRLSAARVPMECTGEDRTGNAQTRSSLVPEIPPRSAMDA
jgi:hypothetical protein